MTTLPPIEQPLNLLTDKFFRDLDEADRRIAKLNNRSIGVKTELGQLHEMNRVIDSKLIHLDQLHKAASKPVKPLFDGSNLSAGINQVRTFRREIDGLHTSVMRSGSISATLNHKVSVDMLRHDNILAYEFQSVSREISRGFRDVIKEISALRPSMLQKALGFAGSVATAPLRFAGGVASNFASNIFTGFTEDIGRTLFGEFARGGVVSSSAKIKSAVRSFNDYVVGRENQVYETFLSELLRSGSFGKATEAAMPRTEIGKIKERLLKLQTIATESSVKKQLSIINNDPELKAILQNATQTVSSQGGSLNPKQMQAKVMDQFLSDAQPTHLFQKIALPFVNEFKGLLTFIQGMQSYRTSLEAQKYYNERKAGFPNLGNQDVVSVIGGAQFKGGQGGRQIGMSLEMLAPNKRFIPVENPETDTDRTKPRKSEQWFTQQLKTLFPELDDALADTAVNVFRQVTHSLNPTGYSTAAAQAITNTKLAQEQGRQGSVISYSGGGADAIRAEQAMRYMGIKSGGTLAMAYPFANFTNNTPSTFNAALAQQDALSAQIRIGAFVPNDQQTMVNIGDTAGVSMNNHHQKHLFKSVKFLDLFFRTIGAEIPDLSPAAMASVVHAGDKLYTILGAAKQLESLVKTGDFDKNSPFHRFHQGYASGDPVVSVQSIISKFLEYQPAVNTLQNSPDAYLKEIGSQLNNLFAGVKNQLLDLLQKGGANLPQDLQKNFTGYLKNQSDSAYLNNIFDQMASGTLPVQEASRLSRQWEVESAPWFQKEGGQFGDFQSTLVDAFKYAAKVAKQYVDAGGKISKDSINYFGQDNFNEDLKAFFNKKLDTSTLPKEEIARIDNWNVPDAFKKIQSGILAYNNMAKSLKGAIPDINEFEKIGKGMSGAIALIGQNLVYKTDLDPAGAKKIGTKDEIAAYNIAQGRLSPLLAQAIPGQALVTERIEGRSLKDILERIAKPIKELSKKRDNLIKQLEESDNATIKQITKSLKDTQEAIKETESRIAKSTAKIDTSTDAREIKQEKAKLVQYQRDIRDLQSHEARYIEELASFDQQSEQIKQITQEIKATKKLIEKEKTRFNKAAKVLYEQVGRLGAAYHEMGIAHNDLAAGNVFFTKKGVVGIDFGNATAATDGKPLNKDVISNDRATAYQRAVIDKSFWGIMNPLTAVMALNKGFNKPFALPETRQLDSSVLVGEGTSNPIPLGTNKSTLLQQSVTLPPLETVPRPQPVAIPTPSTPAEKTTAAQPTSQEALFKQFLDQLTQINNTVKGIRSDNKGYFGGGGSGSSSSPAIPDPWDDDGQLQPLMIGSRPDDEMGAAGSKGGPLAPFGGAGGIVSAGAEQGIRSFDEAKAAIAKLVDMIPGNRPAKLAMTAMVGKTVLHQMGIDAPIEHFVQDIFGTVGDTTVDAIREWIRAHGNMAATDIHQSINHLVQSLIPVEKIPEATNALEKVINFFKATRNVVNTGLQIPINAINNNFAEAISNSTLTMADVFDAMVRPVMHQGTALVGDAANITTDVAAGGFVAGAMGKAYDNVAGQVQGTRANQRNITFEAKMTEFKQLYDRLQSNRKTLQPYLASHKDESGIINVVSGLRESFESLGSIYDELKKSGQLTKKQAGSLVAQKGQVTKTIKEAQDIINKIAEGTELTPAEYDLLGKTQGTGLKFEDYLQNPNPTNLSGTGITMRDHFGEIVSGLPQRMSVDDRRELRGLVINDASQAKLFNNLIDVAAFSISADRDVEKVAKDAITKLFTALARTAKEQGSLEGIGSNIINSLLAELIRSGGKITPAIKEIAKDLPDTFKDVLGIKSPSKVFESIGKDIVAGLDRGLDFKGTLEERQTLLEVYVKSFIDLVYQFDPPSSDKKLKDLSSIEKIRSLFDRVSNNEKINTKNISGYLPKLKVDSEGITAYEPSKNRVSIGKGALKDATELINSFTHELTHAIQYDFGKIQNSSLYARSLGRDGASFSGHDYVYKGASLSTSDYRDDFLDPVLNFKDKWSKMPFVGNILARLQGLGDISHVSKKTYQSLLSAQFSLEKEAYANGFAAAVKYKEAGKQLNDPPQKLAISSTLDSSLAADIAALKALKAKLKKESEQAGKSIGEGAAAGVGESAIVPVKKTEQMFKDTITTAKRVLDSNSPSRVFIQIGRDVVLGYEIGLKGEIERISRLTLPIPELEKQGWKNIDSLKGSVLGEIDVLRLKDMARVDAKIPLDMAVMAHNTTTKDVWSKVANANTSKKGVTLDDLSPRKGKPFMSGANQFVGDRANDMVDAINKAPDNADRGFWIWFNSVLDEIEATASTLGTGLRGLGNIIGALEEKMPGVKRIVDNLKGFAGGILLYLGVQQFEQIIVDFGRAGVTTALQLERIKVALTYDPSVNAASKLKDIARFADDVGANALVAAENYSKLAVAAANTPVAPQSEAIFRGFTGALVAQGADPEEQRRAILSIQQMIGKGEILAEELRAQLAEVMPQAIGAMARSKGLTQEQLTNEMKDSKLFPQTDLLPLARQLEFESTVSMAGVRQGPLGSISRFQNAQQRLQAGFGQTLLGVGAPLMDNVATPALDLLGKTATITTSAIALLATLLAGKFIASLISTATGTRVLTIALKALGLEMLTNNFILDAWNSKITSQAAFIAPNTMKAQFMGLGSGILTATAALAPWVALFVSAGVAVDLLTKHWAAHNTEFKKSVDLYKEMVDNLVKTGKLSKDLNVKNQITPETPGYGFLQQDRFTAKDFLTNLIPGYGLYKQTQMFDASRGFENYFGLLDEAVQYTDENGKPTKTVRMRSDEKVALETDKKAVRETIDYSQKVLDTANNTFASPAKLAEGKKRLSEADREIARINTELEINRYKSDPAKFRMLQYELSDAVKNRQDIFEDTFGSQTAIEQSIKQLEAAREKNKSEPDSKLREAVDKEIVKQIANSNIILREIQHYTGETNQNIPRLIGQLKLLDFAASNMAEANTLSAGARSNATLQARLTGPLNDVELQARQLRGAIFTTQKEIEANNFVMTGSKAILSQVPDSIGQDALNRPELRDFYLNVRKSPMEAIMNTSVETMQKLISDGGNITPALKLWIEAAIRYKQSTLKAGELTNKLLQAELERQKFDEQRLILLLETNQAIAANNKNIAVSRKLLSGAIGLTQQSYELAGVNLENARDALETLMARATFKSTDPVTFSRDVSNAQKAIADAEVAFMQATYALDDYFRQTYASIRDFTWSVEDNNRNTARNLRGLEESWADLLFDLNNQLLTAQNELKATNDKIARTDRRIGIASISANPESITKQSLNLINDYFASLDDSAAQGRSLEQQQKQIGQEYVTTLRRIREEQEKQLDAERERTRTIVRMEEQYRNLLIGIQRNVTGFLNQLSEWASKVKLPQVYLLPPTSPAGANVAPAIINNSAPAQKTLPPPPKTKASNPFEHLPMGQEETMALNFGIPEGLAGDRAIVAGNLLMKGINFLQSYRKEWKLENWVKEYKSRLKKGQTFNYRMLETWLKIESKNTGNVNPSVLKELEQINRDTAQREADFRRRYVEGAMKLEREKNKQPHPFTNKPTPKINPQPINPKRAQQPTKPVQTKIIEDHRTAIGKVEREVKQLESVYGKDFELIAVTMDQRLVLANRYLKELVKRYGISTASISATNAKLLAEYRFDSAKFAIGGLKGDIQGSFEQYVEQEVLAGRLPKPQPKAKASAPATKPQQPKPPAQTTKLLAPATRKQQQPPAPAIAPPGNIVIPPINYGAAGNTTDNIRDVKTENIQQQQVLRQKNDELQLLNLINELKMLERGYQDQIRGLKRTAFDNDNKLIDLRAGAKGYKTADEEISAAGRSVQMSFIGDLRTYEDRFIELDRLIKDYNSQEAQDARAKALQEADQKGGKIGEQIRERLKLEAEVIETLKQQQGYIANQYTETYKLLAPTKAITKQRKAQELSLAAQNAYVDVQAKLFDAQYNINGMTLTNPAKVLQARMAAFRANDDLRKQLEGMTGLLSPEQMDRMRQMQKEVNDLNIKGAFVDSIPFLKEFSSNMRDAILQTTTLDEAFRKLGNLALGTILDQLTIKPLQNLIAEQIGPLLGFNDADKQVPVVNNIVPFSSSDAYQLANDNLLSFTANLSDANNNAIAPFTDGLLNTSSNTLPSLAGAYTTQMVGIDGFTIAINQATAAVLSFAGAMGGKSSLSFAGSNILGLGSAGVFSSLFNADDAAAGQSITEALTGGFTGIMGGVLNFAEGGPVADAMRRERAESGGRQPVLAVLNTDEYVIPAWEARQYETFKELSQKEVKNFANGGWAATNHAPKISSNNTSKASVSSTQNITINLADTNQLGESMRQLENRRQLELDRLNV